MKKHILLTLSILFSLNTFTQSFINTIWELQNGSPANYDLVSTAIDPSGNLFSTANTLVGSATQIHLNCIPKNGILAWQKNCTGSSSKNNYGVDIKTDLSGNVYICGSYHDGTNYNYIAAKYNASGTVVWQKFYNGSGNNDDIPSAIELDNTGNLYVTGSSYGLTSMTDYATIKYDNNGTQLWLMRYNNANLPDAATDLLVDNSGNVYVTGSSFTSVSNSDITILKYNSSGSLLNTYRHIYSGNGYDLAAEMVFDNSNNIILTGSFDNGIKKFGTLKVSNSLSFTWFNTISGSSISEGYGIYTDNSANVISVGYQNNTYGGSDIIVNKYSPSGSLLWQRKLQNPNPANFAKARKVKTDANGNIYVASDAQVNATKDFLTLALDSTGNTKWTEYYNSPTNGNDVPNAIQLKGSDVIVTGISSVASSKQISTVKYTVFEKPKNIITNGAISYNSREIIIRFDASSVIPTKINNKNCNAGTLSDFVKPEVLQKLGQKIDFGWSNLPTFKIFREMTIADTVSITRLGDTYRMPDFWATFSVILPAGSDEQRIADTLSTIYPAIHYAERNYIRALNNVPNDPLVSNSQASLIPNGTYPNANINIDPAWNIEVGQSYTKVGVIDVPVYWAHEDFGDGTFSGSKIAGGWDYGTNSHISNITNPGGSHGTSTAGVIGALRNNSKGIAGIAGGNFSANNTGAQLYSFGVFDVNETYVGDAGAAEAIVSGAAWNPSTGYGYGLHIENISWGGKANSKTISEAVASCWRNNCTFVAARGNSGTSALDYPACYQDEAVLNVGASGFNGIHKDQTNGDLSFGANNWESSYGGNVDFIAPGCTEIVSAPYYTPNPYSWVNTKQ